MWDDGRLARVWWHERWIPFAQDAGGNLRCVDLAPGPAGTVGQIIDMELQGQHGPCVTERADLEAVLRHHLESLQSGAFDVDGEAIIELHRAPARRRGLPWRHVDVVQGEAPAEAYGAPRSG